MKKSFTLIELIFTIVIIAFIFTTIPKIIYTTNEGFKFTLKEDGIFNMMTKIMDISFKDWDENDTNTTDILLAHHQNILECNSSANPPIRIGGFYSGDEYSRLCQNDLNMSAISSDIGEDSEDKYDDVDDYNNTEINATKNGNTRYILFIRNGYSNEWNSSNYDYDNQSFSYKFGTRMDNNHSNIKYTHTILYDVKYDRNISNAKYWSANIGKVKFIESEQW